MTAIRVVTVAQEDRLIVETYTASNPAAGFLAVGVASEMRRALPLVQDLLAGFGCRDDVAGGGRNANRDIENCITWLCAHKVTNLVLVDAQWLLPHLLATAVEIAAAAGVDLWLVCQAPIEPAWEKTIRAWPVTATTANELRRSFPRPAAPPTTPEPLFPRIVDAPWVTFRATCRDHLSAADFAIVDERFRTAVADGLTRLDRTDLDEDTVLDHLRRRCDGCSTYDELIVEARACQVAAWRSGWLIQIDINQFSAVAGVTPTRRQLENTEWWSRLRVYPEPWRGAACAVAATGIGCRTMTKLSICHVTADDDVIHPSTGAPANVPADGRIYIRSQHALRLLQGARSDDPLFSVDNEQPVRDRRLAQALLDAQLECGLNLTGGRIARGDRTARTWASRLGISVQNLDKVTRP